MGVLKGCVLTPYYVARGDITCEIITYPHTTYVVGKNHFENLRHTRTNNYVSMMYCITYNFQEQNYEIQDSPPVGNHKRCNILSTA